VVAGRRFVRSAIAVLVRVAPALGLVACRDEPTSATAPFVVEASTSTNPVFTVGTTIATPPTFVVRNFRGDALANIPVTITVTRGGGTLANAPLRTTDGATPVGEWTLDTIAGVNELTIVAGSAPPVHITLNGIADVPARLTSGTSQLNGLAGDFLNGLFTLRVSDRYGNPVSGVGIDLSVAKGGGEVEPASLTTDDNGLASGISWRLGRLGGSQQLVATAGPLRAEIAASIRSAFHPAVRFVGAGVSSEVRAAFDAAIDRLQASIVGDLGDVPVHNFDMSRCGMQGAPAVNEVVDDLIIFAMVVPIDGVGKVLASAGPCILRTQSGFPLLGIMRFDVDDISGLASNGRLPAVVLHEMLHVIGIGTLWRSQDKLFGSGTSDPRFIGPQAATQCVTSGGFTGCGDGRVPVENTGGSGTMEVHWREATFDREVMTGFVEANDDMPLSSMSIASLADLGYAVNLLSADPYQVPLPSEVAPRLSPQLLAPWERIQFPLFQIDHAGVIRECRPNAECKMQK
jgi:hypothetical protein